MRNLLNPKTLTITTHHEEEALLSALEAMIDMYNDTVFDEFPFMARQVRDLAGDSDEEITAELKRMHDAERDNLNRLEALQNLLLQLR